MKSLTPVGRFNIESNILEVNNDTPKVSLLENGLIINNLISEKEKNELLKLYKSQVPIPVGVDGIVYNYKKDDPVQSYRSTLFSNTLAIQLYNRIKNIIPQISGFEPIGVNESFRFIDYQDNGVLIPHYDSSYIRNKNEKSLLSLIIYIKTGRTGRTQFIKEVRKEHDFQDWSRMAKPEEILETVSSKECSALMFKHETLHQSEKVTENKIIIRTDIMFKKIGDL